MISKRVVLYEGRLGQIEAEINHCSWLPLLGRSTMPENSPPLLVRVCSADVLTMRAFAFLTRMICPLPACCIAQPSSLCNVIRRMTPHPSYSPILRYAIALLLFSPALPTFAQAPAIQWQRALGGTGSDEGFSVQQTTDDGYIAAGHSTSINGDVTGNHGGKDAWVVRLNSSGTLLWQKCLGGSADDAAAFVRQTSDGGYVVLATARSNDGDVTGNHGLGDLWLVKLDASGALSWQKTLGGSDEDYAGTVQQTADGGYIVIGTTASFDGDVSGNHGEVDRWVVKVDATGTVQWQRALGGSDEDAGKSIQIVAGGYITLGPSNSNNSGDVGITHGFADYWVVMLNDTGAVVWQTTLGGTGFDDGIGMQQAPDGSFLATGFTASNDVDVTGNHGGYDIWALHLDQAGGLISQHCLGGSANDVGRTMTPTADGGSVLMGLVGSDDGDISGNHGAVDIWTAKLDAVGNMMWHLPLGGSTNEGGGSLEKTADGGYVVAGTTWSNDGDVTDNHGNQDLWVVKLAPDLATDIPVQADPGFTVTLLSGTDVLHVRMAEAMADATLAVMDPLGQVVRHERIADADLLLDMTGYARGLYVVALRSPRGTTTRKIVFE